MEKQPWWILLGAALIVVGCDLAGHPLKAETLVFLAGLAGWHTAHVKLTAPKQLKPEKSRASAAG